MGEDQSFDNWGARLDLFLNVCQYFVIKFMPQARKPSYDKNYGCPACPERRVFLIEIRSAHEEY